MSAGEQGERVGIGNPHEHGRFRSFRYLLLHAEMRAGHPVTAEAAGSSPVVPAIPFKHAESAGTRSCSESHLPKTHQTVHPRTPIESVVSAWTKSSGRSFISPYGMRTI
jgi:hypothetical protein